MDASRTIQLFLRAVSCSGEESQILFLSVVQFLEDCKCLSLLPGFRETSPQEQPFHILRLLEGQERANPLEDRYHDTMFLAEDMEHARCQKEAVSHEGAVLSKEVLVLYTSFSVDEIPQEQADHLFS